MHSKQWVLVVGEGLIALERIVAVGRVEAAPMKRLLQALPAAKVIILTGGRKRQTAVVLDSGHVVLTAVPLATLQQQLLSQQDNDLERLDGDDDNEQLEIITG